MRPAATVYYGDGVLSVLMQEQIQFDSHEAARQLFDRTAADYQTRSDLRVYNTSSFVFARRKEIVLSLLDAGTCSGTVLDYGMGPGVFAPDVVQRGLQFVGVDISPVMVERANALGLDNATYIVGDTQKLEEFRGECDVVLAIGLIDYLEEPQVGLGRLIACLKPGGMLIVSFRVRSSIPTVLRDASKCIWRFAFAKRSWRPDSAFVSAVHEKSFSFRSDLRPALGALGMSDFRVRYFNFSPLFFNVRIPRPLWRFWRAADARMAGWMTRWGCTGGVLSARKEA